MEEQIDYQTIIMQLQAENELLRHQMHSFIRVHDLLETLKGFWQRLSADRYNLLIAAMILYWLVNTALAIYDRMERKP